VVSSADCELRIGIIIGQRNAVVKSNRCMITSLTMMRISTHPFDEVHEEDYREQK